MSLTVHYGGRHGRAVELVESERYLFVRSVPHLPVLERRVHEVANVSRETRAYLDNFDVLFRFSTLGMEVLRVADSAPPNARDKARAMLKEEPAIEFAGRVLVDARGGRPVVYTQRLFVKFGDAESPQLARKTIAAQGLEVEQEVPYTKNGYVAIAPATAGTAIFHIAEKLLDDPKVELCHPELLREMRRRKVFDGQWHLKTTTIGGTSVAQSANVERAWRISRGTGVVIAVIDDGVDIDHEEFKPRKTKIVHPRDASRGSSDPRPGNDDNHGTACAGVACATGRRGASGVAPAAKLMPIRLASVLGSQEEADAFVWAADKGADVISCSWGPRDGKWWDPADPVHQQYIPLPDSTRLAIDYAATKGRGGKGCVILFAAGNGNESVDNDGYASYENVIAVAACNDRGKRSFYSDHGKAIWCSFPSDDVESASPVTPGIWTTDRSGAAGYNPGDDKRGDVAGHYTNSFGGTSSACPGAAGIAALMLSVNPKLRRGEVQQLLREACEKIDTANGQYDATGWSEFYGFGRLNALTAVELAKAGRAAGAPKGRSAPAKKRSSSREL